MSANLDSRPTTTTHAGARQAPRTLPPIPDSLPPRLLSSALRPLPSIRYPWPVYLVLAVLLVGPLVGPVFAASGWTLLAWINIPIYFLGENVCPQPALVFYVLDQPMVVCSRCWSAVFGLWTVLLLYKGTAGGAFWRMWLTRPEFLRAAVAVAAFWPWVLDIIAAERGWWFSTHPFMMLSGYLAGLAAGALLLPLAAKKISARS